MKGITYILLFISTFCFWGCKNGAKEVSPQELVQWVENPENELRVSKDFENISFIVQHKPLDYIVAMEQRSNEIPKEVYQETLNEIKGLEYYTLIMKPKSNQSLINQLSKGDPALYQQINEYLSFHIQKDIKLALDNDTLYPTIFHFERDYNLSPEHRIVLAFNEVNSNTDRTFILNEKLIGIGPINFIVKQDNINKTPKIITV